MGGPNLSLFALTSAGVEGEGVVEKGHFCPPFAPFRCDILFQWTDHSLFFLSFCFNVTFVVLFIMSFHFCGWQLVDVFFLLGPLTNLKVLRLNSSNVLI